MIRVMESKTMRQDTWNTYRTTGYTYDVANDQRSAGGVHLHQVRKTRYGWQHRVKQSNGVHASYGPVTPMADAEGAAAYATVAALF